MKIRTKLVLFSAGSAAVFVGAVIAFFTLWAPIAAMRQESGYLQELSRATSEVQIEANRFLGEPLGRQKLDFEEALKRYRLAMAAMEHVVVLPKTNPTLAEAVTAVVNLEVLADTGFEALESSIDDLAGSFDHRYDLDLLALSDARHRSDAQSKPMKLFHLTGVVRNVASVNETLLSVRRVIDEKDVVIATEIARIEGRSLSIALAIFVVAIVVSLAGSLWLSRGIARSLSRIARGFAIVSAGDLSHRLPTTSRDETGALATDVERLLERLRGTFRTIQGGSSRNLALKDSLNEAVASATASTIEIEANAESILAMMTNEDAMLRRAAGDVGAIGEAIDRLHRRLDSQNGQVVESSLVVGSMIRSLEEISEVARANTLLVRTLVAEAESGQAVFDDSFHKVAEINDSIEGIQSLVTGITEIAAMTNILAMNAAIEAAHAGEYGKGFSVVADEIGRLATASAGHSTEIQATIGEVVLKISEARDTKDRTLATYTSLTRRIEAVSLAVDAISQRALSLTASSQVIQAVMDSVAQASTEGLLGSQQIQASTSTLGDLMTQVERISQEVVSNLSEISFGLKSISTAVQGVAQLAQTNGIVGRTLDEAVQEFKTEAN